MFVKRRALEPELCYLYDATTLFTTSPEIMHTVAEHIDVSE